MPIEVMVATSGPSGAVVTVQADASVWVRRRSKGRCSRGKSSSSPAVVAPHVLARVEARSASSASRSAARSRMRRGSSSSTRASGPTRSNSTCSPSVSHGSQLSMPSKVCPWDRRSHCSRPQGSNPMRVSARARTSSVGSSSRQPKISMRSRSSVERWSLTENSVSRSTSSPQRSMRTGRSAVEGNTSMIEPRTASSPRCSTTSSRR